MGDFDEPEETPAPPKVELPPQQAEHLQQTFNIALEEHQELLELRLEVDRLRLERAALLARADEAETTALRYRRQVAALAARCDRFYKVTVSMKSERDAARKALKAAQKKA